MRVTRPREWLRLTRIHSSALTIPAFITGYLLTGHQLFSTGALEWAIFGLIYHIAGFSHNNLTDYEYDSQDPNKVLFPLGHSISLASARKFIFLLHILGISYGLIFLIHGPAVFLFGAMYAFGLLYNWTNKRTSLAGIFIGINFGFLPFLSFYATTFNYQNPIILAVAGYGFLQVFFQNAISGALKDLGSDTFNLLKMFHTELQGTRLTVTRKAWALILSLKCLPLAPLGYIILETNSLLMASGLTASLMFALMLAIVVSQYRSKAYDNRKAVRRIVLVEVLTFWTGLVALAPLIQLTSVIFLIAFGSAWFIALNELLWGTAFSPRV